MVYNSNIDSFEDFLKYHSQEAYLFYNSCNTMKENNSNFSNDVFTELQSGQTKLISSLNTLPNEFSEVVATAQKTAGSITAFYKEIKRIQLSLCGFIHEDSSYSNEILHAYL